MERQRAELIARNRERLMALNLPGMAAELLPQPQRRAPAAAQHKGAWLPGSPSKAAPTRQRVGSAPPGALTNSPRRGTHASRHGISACCMADAYPVGCTLCTLPPAQRVPLPPRLQACRASG